MTLHHQGDEKSQKPQAACTRMSQFKCRMDFRQILSTILASVYTKTIFIVMIKDEATNRASLLEIIINIVPILPALDYGL